MAIPLPLRDHPPVDVSLLIGNGPAKISAIEVSLFIVSVAINAIATYQFLWTNQIRP
jgi:hypothetical protein